MLEVCYLFVLVDSLILDDSHVCIAFIDPFYSSGVHLALTGALSAAVTIAASIRGTVAEETAARWHDSKVGTAYTRYGSCVCH